MKKSKKILLFGLLISILYVVLCVYMQKDKISAKLSPVSTTASNKKVQEVLLTPKVDTHNNSTKNKSTLEYKIENGVIIIAGNMPILDNNDKLKKTMMRFCGEEYCDRTIVFSADREEPLWKNIAQEFIDLFYEENLTNAYFIADKFGNISIGGELLTKRAKDRIVKIINSHKGSKIVDNTHLKVLHLPKKRPKIVQTDNNNSIAKNTTVVDSSSIDSIDMAQNRISKLLSTKRINFVKNHAKLTRKSVNTLNEVLAILKDVPNAKIIVKGYTDAGGKRSINKWISEVRAKRVKEYLGSHGINPENIEAQGFGEDDLLDEHNPYSPLNRRVEIEIKRR